MMKPEYVFETSWEVCNKVGGIYTVLSSRAKTLMDKIGADKVIFIGPEVWEGKENSDFKEDKSLLNTWKKASEEAGISVRIGRWQIQGNPIAVLVDFSSLYSSKNQIYKEAWEQFGVNSLQAYGDYDEASMFSYAAGAFVAAIYKKLFKPNTKVIYQAHEWMSGLGMLFLKKEIPTIATIFTTHATSIGRSITTNNKDLYKYFEGYNGDQMSNELHMEAKHSIEKASAHYADCFTTVSTFTDLECKQLLDKKADCILPNGFDLSIVPHDKKYESLRTKAREKIFEVASALLGEKIADDTFIVSTSGRNDFRCKGYDVFLQSLYNLNEQLKASHHTTKVLALLEVPCWTKEARTDLLEKLSTKDFTSALAYPFLTHHLYNENGDRILTTINNIGLKNDHNDPVKVILIPCYLDGKDGILNLEYYEALTANDLCIYPSYYEPWGYTPLESCAYRIPCITTDLSGFGQWVNAELGHVGTIEDGVEVIHRDDDNYFEVAHQIATSIDFLLGLSQKEKNKLGQKAALLAEKAQWKYFIKHYFEAYNDALSKTIKE